MGMGKGSEQKTKVEIPKELKAAALKNLANADRAAALPYAPNMGLQVAGFNPTQMAAFRSTDDAAGAFGLPQAGYGGPNTGMNIPGLPAAQTAGGFSGYSTQGVYEDSLSRLPPAVRKLYDNFFASPDTSGSGKGGEDKGGEPAGPDGWPKGGPRVSGFRSDSGKGGEI